MTLFPIPGELRAVTLFTSLYLLIAGFFALQTHNVEFLFYIGIVVVIGCAILLIHRRVGLTSGLIWLLSLWGLLHMIGGIMPVPGELAIDGHKNVFYSLWIIPGLLKYDQLVHAYGFGTATWVCWQSVRPLLSNRVPTPPVLMLCALAGMGLGALNEVVEFTATLLIPNTNVGGYENTGWDLVSNMIGSGIAMLFILFYPSPASSGKAMRM